MSTAQAPYRYAKLKIPFFKAEVPVIFVGRAAYFPVKAICVAVGGLAPQSQVERLREDGQTAPHVRSLPMPTVKGIRDTICIRRQELSIWLARVDVAKTSLRDRSKLQEFQRLLFAAADRFLMGDASDVVEDGPVTTRPVSGRIDLGECPRCGLRLYLDLGDDGNHLRPAEDDEE